MTWSSDKLRARRPPCLSEPCSGKLMKLRQCRARGPRNRYPTLENFSTKQVTLIITTKLLLIQSDLVSLSLTIALPKALGSASARGEFSPSTRASPPLVSIANHAGVGSLQGEA